MLTYQSLQSNSEEVACEVANFVVNGTHVASSGPSSPSACKMPSAARPDVGVIILSSDTNAFADLQLWRADMAAMKQLHATAGIYCSEGGATRGAAAPIANLAGAALGSTAAGQALGLAETVLTMMSSTESASPVTGTVHNEAFMNGIANELQGANIPVLMPDSFRPFALGYSNGASSPFLTKLDGLLQDKTCLVGLLAASAESTSGGNGLSATDKGQIQATLQGIDAFLATIIPMGGGTSSGGGQATGQGSAQTDKNPGGAAPSSTPPPPTYSPTHLTLVLSADGLAQELGTKDDGTLPDNGKWRYILWIKALESGGSVAKDQNLLGTKIRYSGGAVGTYALFTLDGDLKCSGNVYHFEGSMRSQDVETTFH
jgi:hypothetical protein